MHWVSDIRYEKKYIFTRRALTFIKVYMARLEWKMKNGVERDEIKMPSEGKKTERKFAMRCSRKFHDGESKAK